LERTFPQLVTSARSHKAHGIRAIKRLTSISVSVVSSRGDRRKDEHLRWGKRLQLSAGDVVTIEVLDANPSIERTSYGKLRLPAAAAHVKR
jgi:hypothetical protein